MPTRLATYGALHAETSICVLLCGHENQNRNVDAGSSGSAHGDNILFAQATENGDIAIYGKNGVEIRLEDPTHRTNFLLFASYGRCLVSVAAEGSATSWSITAGVPEVVGHIPECIWPDDTRITCAATSDSFLFFGTSKGHVHVAPVDCKSPSGYYVSVENTAPELVGTNDEAGPVVCIAPEPKVGRTALICYRKLVVLWDWEKKSRFNAWSIPDHPSAGRVVAVAWKDDGSHFAVGLSSGIYAIESVLTAEPKRGNRSMLHPQLIGLKGPVEDFSSIADSHTPVLAMDWLNTSLLIAGGRPLGNGGEELVGGITAIDGLVCNERIEGHARKMPSWKGYLPESHRCPSYRTTTPISFSRLWQPGTNVTWMRATPMGYIWVLVNSVVERMTSISWSSKASGLQFYRPSRLIICECSKLISKKDEGYNDDGSSSPCSTSVILPHLFAFAEVTAACDLGLVTSLDSQNLSIGLGLGTSFKSILCGGFMAWSKSIPPVHRDEALCLTRILILGHADGTLTLWDASGSNSSLGSTESYCGSCIVGEQPSLAMLGYLKFSQFGDYAHINGYITYLQVLDCSVRQEHSNGGWYVAVGFSSGIVSVIRLGHRGEQRSSFSPEITKVTHAHTAFENENGHSRTSHISAPAALKDMKCFASADSSIDDVSRQIARAKEMALRISLGDSMYSLSAHSSIDTFHGRQLSRSITLSEEYEPFLTPISEKLTPLPPTAFNLVLRVHSNSITALDLCWDPHTTSDSPIIVACDEVGVVSISQIASREVIIPSCEVPEDCQRSSYCVKFGPYPSTLQEQHATDNCNVDKPYTVAVYLLVNDLLSLYDPVTGKLLLSFGLPFRNFDLSSSHLDPFWLIFTNAQGLPLENQRGGKWITSFDGKNVVLEDLMPHILIAHGGTITFVSCDTASLQGKGMKQRKSAIEKNRGELTVVGSRQLRKGQGIVGLNVIVVKNARQLFTPLAAADPESGGSNDDVSGYVIAIDASGRVQCFSMPSLERLLEEEEEEEKDKGEDKLGAMVLPSPPLRSRPACLRVELGSERLLLPPVILVPSVGELFVQVGPTRFDVFSIHHHAWNIPGMVMNSHPVSGKARRCMVGRLLTKEASDNALAVDVESSTYAARTNNNRLFGRLARKVGTRKGSKVPASFTVNGAQVQKWEEVFVTTTLDSPDSWANADNSKERLFTSRTSSNQSNSRTVTSGSGSRDEVKSIMQDNVRMMHQRGEKLDRLNDRASTLQTGAEDFETIAEKLNKSMDKKNAATCKQS